MTTNTVKAGTSRGIVVEKSKTEIERMITEVKVKGGEAAVIITGLPLISEAAFYLPVTEINGIPVSVRPSCPEDRIFVADTQTFCNVMQYEKEAGMLNAH